MSRRDEPDSNTNSTTLSKLRRKPELLILPFLSFWLIVNVPPWPMYGGSILVLVARWGTVGAVSGSTNSIFPLTYGLALFIFIFFYFRFRKNVGFDRKRSLLLSATIPFGFVAFFETVYQELFFVVRPQLFHTPPSGQLLLASWILLSLSTVPFWKITKKFYLVIAVDISGFLIWLALGYPQIFETGPLTIYALILNIVTKFTFALTYIVLIYDGTEKQVKPLIRETAVETKRFQ
ncbi:MAG: hypothetical protein ACHQ1H_01710 [Nitrososphaerales archaeon]